MKAIGRPSLGVRPLLVELGGPVVQPQQHRDAARLVAHHGCKLRDVHSTLGSATGKGAAHRVEAVPRVIPNALESRAAHNKLEPDQQVVHIGGQGRARDLPARAAEVEEDRIIGSDRSTPDPHVLGEVLPGVGSDRHHAIFGAFAVDANLGRALPEVRERERRNLGWPSAAVEHDVCCDPKPQVASGPVRLESLEDHSEGLIVEEHRWAVCHRRRLKRRQAVTRDQQLLAQPGHHGPNVAAIGPAGLLPPPPLVANFAQIAGQGFGRQIRDHRFAPYDASQVVDDAQPCLSVIVERSRLGTELSLRLVLVEERGQRPGEADVSRRVRSGWHCWTPVPADSRLDDPYMRTPSIHRQRMTPVKSAWPGWSQPCPPGS